MMSVAFNFWTEGIVLIYSEEQYDWCSVKKTSGLVISFIPCQYCHLFGLCSSGVSSLYRSKMGARILRISVLGGKG